MFYSRDAPKVDPQGLKHVGFLISRYKLLYLIIFAYVYVRFCTAILLIVQKYKKLRIQWQHKGTGEWDSNITHTYIHT